jgi:flagellar biosynthesis protein FliR
VSAEASSVLLGLFLVFCRVGSCLMLLPGYASSNIPAQIRLFIAIALSLAISPMLLPNLLPVVRAADDAGQLALILGEILNGAMIGLLGRVFILALQFMANFMAFAIGMGQGFGAPMDEAEPVPAVVSLITLTATVMIFSLNLHAEVVAAIIASYATLPVALGFSPRAGIVALTDNLDETFRLALRIAGPFVVYAVVVNLAVGIANKLTPQVPIYFISLPFVLAGGLILLGLSIGEFLTEFVAAFRAWVLNG